MIHSFLIVGGTKKKREQKAPNVVAQFTFGRTQMQGSQAKREVLTARPKKFDTTILEPEEDKRTITIDQIRDLQHQLSLKPYAAKLKTGIILEAQRTTVEAQNALLKTLEEPPAHSVLILTAPSTKNLLPTIVSRCQIVRLRPEIDLEIESEEHQQAVEEFLTLLRSGRPARQRVAAPARFESRSESGGGESGGGERLAWVEENKKIINDQPSTLNMLDVWISVLRDLLLINSSCPNLVLNPQKPPNSLNNSTTILQSMDNSTETFTNALERTIETKNLIAKTNVSPRLALEVLLLDLPVLQDME